MNSNTDNEIIATFSPSALAVEQIDDLFIKHRIEHYIHGSRVYAITVPRRHAKEAVKLLRQSEFRDRVTICAK